MVYAARRKGGRAPRAGVERYPSGQIKHSQRQPRESEEEATATALDARVRQVLGVEHWIKARGAQQALTAARKKVDNPLLGYALGRLLVVGRKDPADGINQAQHDAGEHFIRLYRARAKIGGWPSPNVRSIGADMVAGGLSTHPEDSDEWVADIRRRWEQMYGLIMEADGQKGEVFEALKRLLIEDLGPQSVREIGAIRVGLNAINRARGV